MFESSHISEPYAARLRILIDDLAVDPIEIPPRLLAEFCFEEARSAAADGDSSKALELYKIGLMTRADFTEVELARIFDELSAVLFARKADFDALEVLKLAAKCGAVDGIDPAAQILRLEKLKSILGSDPAVLQTIESHLAVAKQQVHDIEEGYQRERKKLKTTRDGELKRSTAADPVAELDVAPLGYVTVPIFYGTHRRETGNRAPYDYYGHEAVNAINLGRAMVTVPRRRKPLSVPEPVFLLRWTKDNPSEVCTIVSITPQTEDDLLAAMGGNLSASERGELFVFMHGYRTTFSSGLMRTAQMAVDLGISGACFLYSLPSKGTALGYWYDRERATDTTLIAGVSRFLRRLADDTGAKTIHLVAHSLGSEVLSRSLQDIWTDRGPQMRRKFGEIVFASPDVAADHLKNRLPSIVKLGKRVTVYASPDDLPLWFSKRMSQIDRAGCSAAHLAGIPGVDVIDTKGSWGKPYISPWGHWDFLQDSYEDFRAVIWLSLATDSRRSVLDRIVDQATEYWHYREAPTAESFKRVVHYARALGIDAARETISKTIAAESLRDPHSVEVSTNKAWLDELSLFRAIS